MRYKIFVLASLLASCDQQSSNPTSRATLEPWPFKDASMTLSCEYTGQGNLQRVFAIDSRGKRFALNGLARAIAPPTDTIQSHYDTSSALEAGLKLCENGEGGKVTVFAPKSTMPSDPADPLVKVENGQSGATFVTYEAETIISGERPKFVIVCDSGKRRSFQLYSIQAPATPPPLAGFIATMNFDDARKIPVEMSWGLDDIWVARETGKVGDGASIVSSFLRSERMEYSPPAGYGLSSIRWKVKPIPDEARAICGLSR